MGQNVIELNGKRYDAITGKYLGKASVIPQHILHGKVIDGFVRPNPIRKPIAKPQPVATARVEAPKPAPTTAPAKKNADVMPAKAKVRSQPTPHHVKAHQPQHSKTLMRRAVHKPQTTIKPAIKTQAPAEIMAKPKSAIQKRSAYSLDNARLERATRVNQPQVIKHFFPTDRPAPIHTVTTAVPVIAVRAEPSHPTPMPTKHHDIFETALAHATSHEQPAHVPRKHRTRRKLTNALAVVAAFMVIGGFVTYLNLPHLELRVASMQAGFSAAMPDYAPTGYALQGGIKRTGGTISLSFRSGDSSYTLTQQASNWNSQTLLDNTLALSGAHETIQKDGQTIYVYGHGANASWVNGGIRYDVTGNAQLSKDDIAAIATSL